MVHIIKITKPEMASLAAAKKANGGWFGPSFDYGQHISKPSVCEVLAARLKRQPYKFVTI